MAQVNYVREHIAFKEYAADNSLRSAETRTPEEADSLQFQEDDMRKRTMCSPEAWFADIRRMDGEREERRLKHVQAGRT